MADLRVGIVGMGAIGRAHADALRAVDGLSLAGFAGGGRDRAPPGVAVYSDVASLIADGAVDIVAVTTPSGGHFEPARQAIAAGRHVLVEKPLCVDVAEAGRLVGLARAAGVAAGTVSQRRLEAQHVHLHGLLRAGALGTPRLIEAEVHWHRSDEYYAQRPWRGDPAHGGGSLFNQGIHSLDLMLWLFGRAREASALSATIGHAIAVEDMCSATLAFESGALGRIVTTTATPPGRAATLRVFTDRGHCEIAQSDVREWTFADVAPPPSAAASVGGAADPLAIGLSGHIAQWTDLRDAIREGREPAIPFAEGYEAARTVAAVYRSAQTRRSVALDEIAPRL